MANFAFIPVLSVIFMALLVAAQETGGNETFVVTTILEAPYVMETRSSESPQGNDRYEGYLVDMMEKIAALVGFSYELKLVKDSKYGAQDSNGEWNGMIRELINGKADMSLSAMTISATRARVVDFSKPYMNVGIGILMKKPLRESPSAISPAYMKLLLQPFSAGVWLCLVAAFVLVSILFFVFNRFLPSSTTGEDAQREQDRSGTLPSCLDGFWFTCRSLFFQGFSGDKSPSTIAVRILAFFWFGFVMMSVLLYVVALNNLFPVHRIEGIEQAPKTIQSVQDLSTQTQIKYGTVAGGSTMAFFKKSKVPVYQKMWNVMDGSTPSAFVSTTQEGVDRTLRGGYAFIAESAILDYAASRQCALERVGGLLSSSGYGLAFPLRSPLRDNVSLALLKMQEDQTLQVLYNKWWPTWMCGGGKKEDAEGGTGPTCKPVPLSDIVVGVDAFSGPLVFMVIGVLLAVLAAVVEIVVARATGSKRKFSPAIEDEKL